MFDKPLYLHERLLAYTINREFYRIARVIVKQMPRGNANLSDQLIRSSRTSCLAIAEGANSRSERMKRVFFERAVSSNGESSACLDQVEDDGAAPLELITQARSLLHRASRLTLGLMR